MNVGRRDGGGVRQLVLEFVRTMDARLRNVEVRRGQGPAEKMGTESQS